MAFLAVPAIGAAIGYGIGSYLGAAALLSYAGWGWLAGSILYNAVHKTKLPTQYGPQLADLRIQSSAYGAPIPIIFGTAPCAGVVIWGQPIQQHTETTTQEAGKGGGQEQTTVTYWYSATFAVLVCEGPAIGIRKVWANGELIYNNGADANPGVFLASRDMHIMLGEADQEPSALMESYEGAGNVPAYRGYLVVEFDTMALGTYGNRIPNLEFEVVRSGSLVTLVPQEWVTLPGSEAFYDSGLGDPGRVVLTVPDSSRVWMVLDSGGNPRRLALFNSFSEAYDVTLDFDGNIYLQGVLPSGAVMLAQEGGTAEGLHIINTVGGDEYYPGSDEFQRYVQMAQAGDQWVLHVNAPSGHPIYTVDTDVNPITKTAVTTGKFVNALFAKADAYPNRVYVYGIDAGGASPSPGRVGYVDEDGAWTTLVDYSRNSVFPFGIVGANYIFIRSGNTGESNVIEKRTVDGVLVDSVTLTSASATGYSDTYEFSLDSTEAYLYVKNGDAIWKVATGTMEEELANGSAGTSGELFVQGSAFQGNGVMVTQIGTDDTVIRIVPPEQLLDVAPPTGADIAEDIVERCGIEAADYDFGDLTFEVPGYTIPQPMSARDALETLRPAFFFDLIESDYKIKGRMRTGSSLVTIPEEHLGARSERETIVDPIRTVRIQENDLPRRVHVAYFNKNADYQSGKQSSKRTATESQQEINISLPIVLTDEQAAQLAEAAMYEAWTLRETMEFSTSRRYALYEPTDVLTLEANGLQVEVRAVEKHEGANGLVRWKGVPADSDVYTQVAPGADNGSGQTIEPLAPTEAFPLDIHTLREVDNVPGNYWAARGLSIRWDGAKLYVSYDGGVTYVPLANGLIAAAAGIGALTEDLAGPLYDRYEVFDETNVVHVRARPGVEFSSYTREQVLAGTATPILIKNTEPGGEILYYRDATNTGDEWELSGLLRARGGTKWYCEHDAGELVVILDAALLSVTQSLSDVDRELDYKAPSIGSTLTNAMPIAFTNTSIRQKPLSGHHLGAGFDASGNLDVTWKPSTRIPKRFLGPGPIGEAFERYEIDVHDGMDGDVVATYEVTDKSWQYTAAEQAADFGSARAGYWLSIYQISDQYGRGYPLSGWAPEPAAAAYTFYRLRAMTTNDGRKFAISEFQLIDIDGATIVSSDIVPTSNLAAFTLPAANLTDGDLFTVTNLDPNSAPVFATAVLDFELHYPAVLAGCKQAGRDAFTGGGSDYYLTGFVIAGSNDGTTFTDLKTFFGLAFPGHSTLSSLYTI